MGVYDVTAVARMLCCTEDSVALAAHAGTLPGLKFGRTWVFPAGALFEALNALALHEAQQRKAANDPSYKSTVGGTTLTKLVKVTNESAPVGPSAPSFNFKTRRPQGRPSIAHAKKDT